MSVALPDFLQPALDDDPDRLLLEQAHLVAELVRHPGWEIVSARIRQEIQAWERRILSGGCAERDDYVAATHYARGLRHLLEAPAALDAAAEQARERLAHRPDREERT